MEILDCIAKSEDDYVDIAVNIATNKDLRNSISKQILDNSRTALISSNRACDLSNICLEILFLKSLFVAILIAIFT